MDPVHVIEKIDRLGEVSPWPDIYAGIDEVGVGSIAGPMVAAVVVLPPAHGVSQLPIDSKKLKPDAIQRVAALIEPVVRFAWVGAVDVQGIDDLGAEGARVCLWRTAAAAVRDVLPKIPIVLDGTDPIPGIDNQRAIAAADSTHDAVSAAAILAKSRCDRMMAELDAIHPGYGFAKHKGYGTKEHYLTLQKLGPSPAHRSSAAKAMRKSVPQEERDLPLEELQRMLRDVAPVLKSHPEVTDELSLGLLRDMWKIVVVKNERPSPRAQFFIWKRHEQIMKLAGKKGLRA